MKKTRLIRLVLMATLMAFALCLAPVRVQARAESYVDSRVSQMLAAGDYVEGEAIVCRLGEGDLAAQSDGPLEGAERLSEVTARQYAEATGEMVPAQDGLTAQSEDEPVEVLLVRSDGASTEELLRELLSDPCVLSAEPNYIMRFEEDGQASVPDDASSASPSDDLDEASDGSDDSDGAPANQQEIVADEGPDDSVTGKSQVLTDSAAKDAEASLTLLSGDDIGPATLDLTGYQWFSMGVAAATPQYLKELNPGVNAPNWNEPGTTNASGVVAILDSGVDYTHPDLANVMYHFTSEQQAELGCGEFGYAPAREDKTDPMDGYDHGTHCAGIVAAEWNGFGVSGIANGVKLVAVSVSESVTSESFSYDSIIKGYDFLIRAAKAGVDIRSVNRSLDKDPANNANEVMVRAAGEVGIVTCLASGNEHYNLDEMHEDGGLIQPNPYIVRVNASNPQDYRAPFSNYGRYTTDLFAPGVSILSTIPSTKEGESRYFPEADSDPLFVKTDFDSWMPDVLSSDFVEVSDVSRGDIGVDGDSSSIKAHIATETGAYASVYVDVPVGALSKDEVQDIGVAFNIGENEGRYADLSILLDNETYADESLEGIVLNGSDGGPNGWIFARLHITDPDQIPGDFAHVKDSRGNTCVRLCIGFRPYTSSYEGDEPLETDMHIDQIAFGKSGNSGFLPYCYMTGTSMATPCVTGCAAIVSSIIDADDPAERATQTVRTLKGAVRQAEGYHGLCKQNGQLDLNLLGSEDEYVPTIESARLDGSTLVVSGAYFTSDGTLLVRGAPVKVLSWSDGSIEAEWPEGLASGLIPITVRTDGGAEACRAFILEAPEGTSGSAALYERDLTPINASPDGTSATSVLLALVAAEDGTLFATPTDNEDRIYDGTRYLMRSDNQGSSWSGIELPIELKDVSLAAGGGKVFVLGGTPADRGFGEDYWELYSFDVSQGTFEQLAKHDAYGEGDDTFHSTYGTLAYANGQLFYVDYYEDFDDDDAHPRMRVRRVNVETGLLENPVLLEHELSSYTFNAPPKIAMAGNSFYVCNMTKGASDGSVEQAVDLERVDVASDGSLSCTDLSAALYGLSGKVAEEDFCIAASEEGIFLIGAGLDALLPAGAERTDTFFLKNGAVSFEPYARTLSYGPMTSPVSVCANGWLYAYAISNYEDMPVFGRATKVAEEKPEPAPGPDEPDSTDDSKKDDMPSKDDASKKGSATTTSATGTAATKSTTSTVTASGTALAKTGDDLVKAAPIIALLAGVGVAFVIVGLKKRNK